MINKIFLVMDDQLLLRSPIPLDENVYYSLHLDTSSDEKMQATYRLMSEDSPCEVAFTFFVYNLPDVKTIRFITSFLFLPSCLRINSIPVINFFSDSDDLLQEVVDAVITYFTSQSISLYVINKIFPYERTDFSGFNRMLETKESLERYYKSMLAADKFYDNNIFYRIYSTESIDESTALLSRLEFSFKETYPKLYMLANAIVAQKEQIESLKNDNISIGNELRYHKQYIEILRDNHSTKLLQDYYNKEYEVLPLWFKRLGHLLKVITGKRNLRSLIGKKYKG